MKNNQARKNLFIQVNIWRFLDKNLLAELGPQNTQTLLALALFLPDSRPPISLLSIVLGVSTTTASQRLMKLEKFRYEGEPIIHIQRKRDKKGHFKVNNYHFLDNSGITIFKVPY